MSNPYPNSRRLDDTDRNILRDLRGEGEDGDCDHDETAWAEFPGQPVRRLCVACNADVTDTHRNW
jgi:hypothetical protein